MADKLGRTRALQSIYKTYLDELPHGLAPMVAKNNTEELLFDNPDDRTREKSPGLRSGISYETALDPNAGRSTSRQFAHLSECAFYRSTNYLSIDEGIQNSIPLAKGTAIIKESTANGRSGDGQHFFNLWQAAKRGESLYKIFFVPWFEVDDYAFPVPDDFKATKEEKDRMKQFPQITEGNLLWWRMKLMEYQSDTDNAIMTPFERMQADFPDTDTTAFLATGSPVFPADQVHKLINKLTNNLIQDLKDKLGLSSYMLKNHWRELSIYEPPRQGKEYFVGADVAEGLATGDASSAFVMDESMIQVAKWHGKIDADMFGHLLIALGALYNDALIVPENNNMGHTTVVTIRNHGYRKLYKTTIEDKVEKKKTDKYGWTTTAKSKMDMLSEFIRALRENLQIRDIRLAEEMASVAREENGNVILNGRDRTVACGLAIMGHKHYYSTRPLKVKHSAETVDMNLLKGSKPKERAFFE